MPNFLTVVCLSTVMHKNSNLKGARLIHGGTIINFWQIIRPARLFNGARLFDREEYLKIVNIIQMKRK